jgi:hypothetical protein
MLALNETLLVEHKGADPEYRSRELSPRWRISP